MSDDEDELGFNSSDKFEKTQELNKTIQENNEHYRQMTSISKAFFSALQDQNDFNHKTTWRSYSPNEPIKIQINTSENLPGICDLLDIPDKGKYDESLYMNKVLMVFTSLAYEIENTLPSSTLNPFEYLYPLTMYNDSPDEAFTLKPNEEEQQISQMLSYLNDLYDKMVRLYQIACNLFHQVLSLYSSSKFKGYFENFKFALPFDYIGLIFAFYLAIDEVFSKNEELKTHWEKYRIMIHNCKQNVSQYNVNEEQFSKLEKIIKNVNGGILEKKCYEHISHKFIEKVKKMTINNKPINSITNSKSFIYIFTEYLRNKFTHIETYLDSLTDSNESLHLFQALAVFGLYLQLVPNSRDQDKKLIYQAWSIQKKVSSLHIVGNCYFSISNFFTERFNLHNIVREDPKLYEKRRITTFDTTLTSFPFLIGNMRHTIVTWVTKMESQVFSPKINIQLPTSKVDVEAKKQNILDLSMKTKERVKLILNGISLGNYIRRTISNILESHVSLNRAMKENEIPLLTTAIELLKIIEHQFNKMLPYIALELNIMNRSLLRSVQVLLENFNKIIDDKVAKGKSANTSFYKYAYGASSLLLYNSNAAPSKIRRIISQLCYEALNTPKLMRSEDSSKLFLIFWELETLNQLSKEIQKACDCSFLYWYQNIIPKCLKSIYNDKPKRLYYFSSALNDIEIPLHYIKHRNDNGKEFIEFQRKNMTAMVEENFLQPLCTEIEVDLRKLMHSILIRGLYSPEKTNNNLNTYLTILPFSLYDKVIDIKRFVEEYLNLTFYKMTTLNLNDWKTYQQMRVLAKSKYDLHLHEVFLPSQNLEQGKDIIEIIRKLNVFSKSYTHNLHSQIFMEIIKENQEQPMANTINVIGVNQILNSLYTHGTGIVNSVVNSTYQQLTKLLQKFVNILGDDYIKSVLKDQRTYWMKNKQQIKYHYPYTNAEEVLKQINSVSEQQYTSNLIEQIIKLIKQIGNAVALTRCIRTALMEYNSQNANLISMNSYEHFGKITEQIQLVPSEEGGNATNVSANLLSNTQNSFKDANKMFNDTVSMLKQTGENNKNYLSLLVTSYGDALSYEKMEGVDLFAFFFPALTITFVEMLINARERIERNTKGVDQYFSDDGFIMGICYLNKLFRTDFLFDSLNWFPSVLQYFAKQKKIYEAKKNVSKGNDLDVSISGKRIMTYMDEFRMLYYTYSSAVVLFNE